MIRFASILFCLAVFCPPAVEIPHGTAPVILQDDSADSLVVRRCIVGAESAQSVGDVLLLADDSEPKIANVGYLTLTGGFTASSVIADDDDRRLVETRKVNEHEWLIVGTGRVLVVATLATKEPFGIEHRRFEIVIPGVDPEPEPDVPDPDVPGPDPDVPEDRFNNLGQRVAEASSGLPKRAEVAANYLAFATKLEGSVEAAELSQQMVDERTRILGSDLTKWQPVLTLISEDFTTRRPSMLRRDVVEHWRAVAAGLGGVQ
jgi:hypothetical protein